MSESARLFPNTQWSAVLSVKNRDRHQGQSLERLCQIYHYPVYAMIRKRGRSPDEAEDLAQEFFYRLITGNFFEHVAPSRGKFRHFLIASINNFLTNEWHRSMAQKRGGVVELIRIDAEAEDRYRLEPVDLLTPDQLFDRRCALALMEEALKAVRMEFEAEGKEDLFEEIKPLALGDGADSFGVAAEKLRTSEGALRVAVHRLRKRIAHSLRLAIRDTVETDEQVDEELRQMKLILRGEV